MRARECFVALVLAAALLISSGCTSPQTPEDRYTQDQVTYVPSPTRQHVAVLMWSEVHGLGKIWAWYRSLPTSGTSLAVLDNDPPYTLGSKNAPIVHRRLVFTSTCEPQDFLVSWLDDSTVSIATRCPKDKLFPSKTPANGINVTYTRLQ
jgi:hypothetical protein